MLAFVIAVHRTIAIKQQFFAYPGQLVTINLLLVHSPYHKFPTVKIENVDGIYKSPFVCGSYAVPVQYQLSLNECKSLT